MRKNLYRFLKFFQKFKKPMITFREVEGEGGLLSSKVFDVEDKIFREVVFGPPNNPPNSGINKAVLMTANIDALHQRKAEIPFKLWINEGRNESATGCVNMNRSIPSANKLNSHDHN